MSERTDAQLTTEAQVIRDETAAGGNTKTRVYNILKNIIDSKPNKLDGRFRGIFLSLSALESAVPVGNPGDYADVDEGADYPPTRYIWDESDLEWVAGSSPGGGTVASVTGDGVGGTASDPVITLKNGLPSADTTGVAIAFATPQIYGTPGSPETGNITLVTTGLVPGMVQVLYHDNGTEPTYPAEFVKLGGTYSTAVLNIIYMCAISAARIEYVIKQES